MDVRKKLYIFNWCCKRVLS